MSEEKTNSTDLYGALGLDKNASAKDVKKAYRKLARKYHPDNKKTGDVNAFRLINQAYETLKDELRREFYDRTGSIPPDDMGKPERDMSSIYEVVIHCFQRAVNHTVESEDTDDDGKKIEIKVDISSMNIIGGAKEINKQQIASMKENRVKGMEHLSKVAEIRRRLKFTGEGFDPLENFYRKEEEATAEQLKELDKSIANWEEGGEFLNNYQYLFDDGQMPPDVASAIKMLMEGQRFIANLNS